MRGRTKWIVITCAALVALTPGAASASHRHAGVPRDGSTGERLYGCEQGERNRDETGLVKSTEPSPGAVTPGQEIRVELTWRTEDFVGAELHKVLDCVTVDGKFSVALSGGEKPSANDGRFHHSYVVPADAAPGTLLCDQGFAIGPTEEDEYARKTSGKVCFTVERPRALPPIEEVSPAPADSYAERLGDAAPVGSPVSLPEAEVAPPAVVELPHTGGSTSPIGQVALACLALAVFAGWRSRRLL